VPARTRGIDCSGLLRAYPDLRRHACDNGRHLDFAHELADTETVHAVEHLAVELLACADGGDRTVLRGVTGTPTDGSRVHRMKIYGTRSPDVALSAVRYAAEILGAYYTS
jgi:hypothetical protein